nr:glycosyltransferase family 39 protein [Harryflintia acetispora]
MFAFLFDITPTGEHFYYDHIVTIGQVLEDSVWDTVQYFATANNALPPLNAIIMHFWLKISPHTIQWVCLIPNVYISLSIFLLGYWGKKFVGRTGALFIVFLALTSQTFLEYGNDIRAYSLTILSSIFVVFLFVNAREEEHNIKKDLLFALSLVFVAYTNYHALVVCLALFVLDILLFSKKLRFKILYPYIIAGILYLPWFITVAINLVNRISEWADLSTWHLAPTYKNAWNIFISISGGSTLGFALVFLSVLFVLASFLFVQRKQWLKLNLVWITSTFVFSFYLMILFGNAIINPQNTLLQYRYFSPCIPLAIILQGLLVEYVLTYIFKKLDVGSQIKAYSITLMFILCFLGLQVRVAMKSNTEGKNWWLSTAQTLTEQNDLYSPTTAIVLSKETPYAENVKTGLEYFMYHEDFLARANFLVLNICDLQEMDYKKVYLVDGKDLSKNALTNVGYEFVSQSWGVSIFTN